MIALTGFTTVFATMVGVFAQAAGTGYDTPDMMKYVYAGWALIIVGVAVYAVLMILKGRQLAKRLPPEERRWMS